MILTQQIKAEQLNSRLLIKTAEAAFAHTIVEGTNCSSFESEIIVEKAKEAFRVGQWAEQRVLEDGQIICFATSADAPPGKPLKQCPKVRLVLTLIRRDEDLQVLLRHGSAARRRQQIARMTVEARDQGGLLTQEDLALLLGNNVKTIRADIARLRREGILVPTRGTVQDIGPGVTHKHKAIELWLAGKEPTEIASHLKHSLTAIERYISPFCRVVFALSRFSNIAEIALVVGISVNAAQDYRDLHEEMLKRPDGAYKLRLQEVLRIGELHFAADEKKTSEVL
jgi:hypothetical protein